MTIAVSILDNQIRKISETNTLLDMLLEFEKTLEDLDIYAYKHWELGEVLEGPTMSRHFVTVKLLYDYKEMPDPSGAKRLMEKDCLVKYQKDTLISPKKVKTFDDVEADIRTDGSVRHKAKTTSKPVWVIEVKMPRRYVDEFNSDVVEADADNYVDTESMNAEQQVDTEQQLTGGSV
jgi:hypothetical protein